MKGFSFFQRRWAAVDEENWLERFPRLAPLALYSSLRSLRSKIQLKAFKSFSKVEANFSHKIGINCKGNLSLGKLVKSLTKGMMNFIMFCHKCCCYTEPVYQLKNLFLCTFIFRHLFFFNILHNKTLWCFIFMWTHSVEILQKSTNS